MIPYSSVAFNGTFLVSTEFDQCQPFQATLFLILDDDDDDMTTD